MSASRTGRLSAANTSNRIASGAGSSNDPLEVSSDSEEDPAGSSSTTPIKIPESPSTRRTIIIERNNGRDKLILAAPLKTYLFGRRIGRLIDNDNVTAEAHNFFVDKETAWRDMTLPHHNPWTNSWIWEAPHGSKAVLLPVWLSMAVACTAGRKAKDMCGYCRAHVSSLRYDGCYKITQHKHCANEIAGSSE